MSSGARRLEIADTADLEVCATEVYSTWMKLSIRPLTPARWPALRVLFGDRGGCGGCWCMYWRLPHGQWVRQKGPANERALHQIVGTNRSPGLLAYAGREPVGWCALAPRSEYPRLAKSRILKPVDDAAVWSVTCFFIARPFRRQGVSRRLLQDAALFAARHGATILEGYPCELKAGYPDVFYYTGLVSAFQKVGFRRGGPPLGTSASYAPGAYKDGLRRLVTKSGCRPSGLILHTAARGQPVRMR
jgi:GNAT superfamily N-acetyltransferase